MLLSLWGAVGRVLCSHRAPALCPLGINNPNVKDLHIISVKTVNKCREHYVFGSDWQAQFTHGDGHVGFGGGRGEG